MFGPTKDCSHTRIKHGYIDYYVDETGEEGKYWGEIEESTIVDTSLGTYGCTLCGLTSVYCGGGGAYFDKRTVGHRGWSLADEKKKGPYRP